MTIKHKCEKPDMCAELVTLLSDRFFSRTTLRLRRAVLFLIPMVFAAAFATSAIAANDPTANVKSLIDSALSVVHSKEMSLASKRDEFRNMVERHFDVAGMARDSLGDHWSDLSAAAQSKFSQAFSSIVADTYLGEIRDYDRAQIQIVSQELSGANAEVSGNMRNSGDEVADLKFKLRNIAGNWKIKDYSFNTDSATGNHHGEFQQAFEKGGFDGLMARVKAVQAKLDADLAHNPDGAPR
jgi:phospholipid transport system substrate-binding protein